MPTEEPKPNTPFLSPHLSPTYGWPPGAAVLHRLLKESSHLMVAHRATCAEAERAYNELWAFTCQLLHDECRANILDYGRCYVARDSYFTLSMEQRERLLLAVQKFSGGAFDGGMQLSRDQGYIYARDDRDIGPDDWFFYHKLNSVWPHSDEEVEGWSSTVYLIPASLIGVNPAEIPFCGLDQIPFSNFLGRNATASRKKP